jgi:ABC-2 type transport system ATP-binding protein
VSQCAIEVSDLRKSYGDFEAVRGISFVIEPGEVFGLLGPNGAGKTTTVEILEGYRERDAGSVSVLGHDPGDASLEMRQRVGIVLQSSGFYPRVTVKEAVQHWALLYPKPRDPDEVIALVGLDGKHDARAGELSGGQQRRLDLALALVGDPEVVFLDEPTTGFDPAARRTAWNVVRALKDLGKTVLLSDRVAIIKNGVLVAEGSPSELGVNADRYTVAYDSNGSRVELETDDPTELLNRLTNEALGRGERLEGLTVSRPTLEQVYLELTEEAESE